MKKFTDRSHPSSDGVSLHTNPGGGSSNNAHTFDDDIPQLGPSDINDDDELPPLYSDIEHDSSSNAPLLDHEHAAARAASSSHATHRHYRAVSPRYADQNTGHEFYMDNSLDQNPELLASHINGLAELPPRYLVQLLGTHRETVEEHGKKERRDVTDFDVRVEVTPYLYSDATNRVSWKELRLPEDGDKCKRGTVFKRRAPGFTGSIEVGRAPKPTLLEWCNMYRACHAGLKCFTLRRRVVGFDEALIRRKLESLVRSANYRGHLQIKFVHADDVVEVYNDCRTNDWRLTQWIRIVCYITLMFLLTWPYLFFRTKRFEVVTAEWPFSRPDPERPGQKQYVALSEKQFYNLWGRAIYKAVLERRQCTLNQQDLISSQGAQPTFNTGNGTLDRGLGVLAAGISAMNVVNTQLGWGGDHY